VGVLWLGVAVVSPPVDAALHHPPRSRLSLSGCTLPPVRAAAIGSYAPQPRV
jgi:hypothetical protein